MKRRFKKKHVSFSGKGIIRSNEKLIILVFAFLIGLISGAFAVKNNSEIIIGIIKKLTESAVLNRASESVFKTIINYALPDFTALVISLVFAFSVIGESVIWIIPFIRGLGLGLSLAYILSAFKTDGLSYLILFIVIPASLSVAALIIACKENVITSGEIRRLILKPDDTRQKIDIKMIVIRNLITLSIILFSAVLGGVLNLLFSQSVSLPV